MAYVITDDCINCGACESECIMNAISSVDGKYTIDPELCIDCGECEHLCPEGASSKQE